MNIPGFTAEASVYITTGRFRTGYAQGEHTEGITPQAKVIGKPCRWYNFTCRDCVSWDDEGSCNGFSDPYPCPVCI